MDSNTHLANISQSPINIEEMLIEKFLVSYRNNFEDEKLKSDIETLLTIYQRVSNFVSKYS